MDTSEDFLKLIQDCEEWLRAGQDSRVASKLSHLNTAKIPREYLLSFAKIARRSNQLAVGLRLLTPLMGAKAQGFSQTVTPHERSEYGVLLQKIGSIQQALKMLETVSPDDAPEVLLYRSFCYFPLWEYEKAWPLLQAYVAHPRISEYEKFIGWVNMASTAVVLEYRDQAETLLVFLRQETKRRGYHRLYSNILELSAQLAIQIGDRTAARAWLEEGYSVLKGEASLDILFLQKWRAVLAAEEGDLEQLHSFRALAANRGHWESLRETDLHLVKFEQNDALTRYLYAGSPIEGYRRRILKIAPEGFCPPSDFVLGHGDALLDLPSGTWNGSSLLPPGQKIHLFLQYLFSDFYRPRRLATIFSEVFNGDYFDILSSPNRVYQIVNRSRELIEEHGLPVSITEFQGNYHYQIKGNLQIRVNLEKPSENADEWRLKMLSRAFGQNEFSAKDARAHLALPLTTYHRWMKWALENGYLHRLGHGSSVNYILKSQPEKKAS